MLPAITTTHARPHSHPSHHAFAEDAIVRCRYCLEPLGVALDDKGCERLQKEHKCHAKRLMKKPSASVPYN